MAIADSALLELLDVPKAAGVEERVRLMAQRMFQSLIEAEAGAVIGADRWQHTDDRVAVRNGTRPPMLATTVGDLELRIPKLRDGSFFPALLERRRRVDQALFAVVMEAYVHGVSTRKVDDLVAALGATWQRCRVHWLHVLITHVPKGHGEMFAAAIRTIFSQPKAREVHAQFDTIAMMLGRQFPKLEGLMTEAKTDVLAFTGFPRVHWKQIWSTNPLERVNKEIKRRSDVVGVFPNPAALLRLAGALLIERHDVWAVADRRYFAEHTMKLLDTDPASSPNLTLAIADVDTLTACSAHTD